MRFNDYDSYYAPGQSPFEIAQERLNYLATTRYGSGKETRSKYHKFLKNKLHTKFFEIEWNLYHNAGQGPKSLRIVLFNKYTWKFEKPMFVVTKVGIWPQKGATFFTKPIPKRTNFNTPAPNREKRYYSLYSR